MSENVICLNESNQRPKIILANWVFHIFGFGVHVTTTYVLCGAVCPDYP